ncbi:MAG: o-succinylbenzoate synthase [Acidimicrobiales bacterium]
MPPASLPAVRPREVALRRLRLPLVSPFRTPLTTMTERTLVVVAVDCGEHTGWGECVALPEPVYSPEWVDGAHEVLRRFLVRAILATDALIPSEVAQRLAFIRGHPMAKAALEMAVLDASLRFAGVSLATFLGASRDTVEVGVAVGMAESIESLLAEVDRYLGDGYQRIKLKIEPGWDLEPVAAVRGHVGPDVALQVDANAAYGPDDIAHLVALDRFGLLLIEQPFSPADLRAHARLAEAVVTPICLDESIESEADAVKAVEMGACSVINLKPGRVGGYLQARRIHDLCLERGVGLWCGGMLETGLGRAANLALASLPGFSLPSDISASDRYYRPDLTEAFVLGKGSTIAVPAGAGIGVAPDPAVLDAATTTVEVLRPD